ncbi:DUF2256 domain-containing protein [Sphingomonas xinjiangensis]|uniref:Uncharacterized protein n=1 Tax=Sphingomonas xinjiangensis TaxID=643568 RepID=A0A840YPE6_9SPHN|nr:DUF2256 domain-containing protein [Sphingomonas xinjiangensis]MBB5709313.1 hypothetical protein [Sphingomonas xinjiangensis]
MKTPSKTCAMCGTTFFRKKKITHKRWEETRTCGRACGTRLTARDPAWRQRVGEGRKAYFAANPEAKAALVVRANAQLASFRHLADRAKAGRTKSQMALGWCPPEWLDQYKKWRRDYGATTAREMVEGEIADAEKRRLAALTPLQRRTEEQIKRVQAGAGLITVPVMRRAEHDFSLTGNALVAM